MKAPMNYLPNFKNWRSLKNPFFIWKKMNTQPLRNYPSKFNPLKVLTAITILALLTSMLLLASNTNDLKPIKPTKPLTLNTTNPQPNCTQTTTNPQPNCTQTTDSHEPKKSKASTNLTTNDKPKHTK
uniref:H-orf protein n=1 Tax=Margaritifera falcata TaxID=52361 RepID=F4ZFY3_MARFC|nr:h-orf protein [Margaritifera falcata]